MIKALIEKPETLEAPSNELNIAPTMRKNAVIHWQTDRVSQRIVGTEQRRDLP